MRIGFCEVWRKRERTQSTLETRRKLHSIARVRKAINALQNFGGSESGLSPLWKCVGNCTASHTCAKLSCFAKLWRKRRRTQSVLETRRKLYNNRTRAQSYHALQNFGGSAGGLSPQAEAYPAFLPEFPASVQSPCWAHRRIPAHREAASPA